jgi:hypothetical protein
MGNDKLRGTSMCTTEDSTVIIDVVGSCSRFVGWGFAKKLTKVLNQVTTDGVQPQQTETNNCRETPVR